MKSMKEKQDGTLVELSLLGNQKAYEELVLRHEKAVLATKNPITVHTTGELFKIIDGKVYFWSQPGYSDGAVNLEGSIFWNCQCCDSMLPDAHMRAGESIVPLTARSH